MSSTKLSRGEMLERLAAEGQKNSTSTILFHHALAERLGLNPTDHKCVDIIIQKGPITAGQLAEITGLRTGSITTALDRLEKAKFVKRVADPHDRRKVLIEAMPERFPEVAQLFAPFMDAQSLLLARYSDEQLATILDYVTLITRMIDEQAALLRENA